MINIPKISDPRGNLSFIQNGDDGCCPFELESVAWCYDIPGGNDVHIAPDNGSELMAAALSGSFTVGGLLMCRSDRGIILPATTATLLECLATNTVALLLGSSAPAARQPGPEDIPPVAIKDAHRLSDVAEAHIIALPRTPLPGGGSVTRLVNGDGNAPFNIRRIFYLYDVPADSNRGGHSHYAARELIIAMSGSFDVVLDDGKHPPRRFTLNRPYHALYVPTGLWRTLDNFSGGAVSAVLTSHRFAESDYVRDYDNFRQLCKG